MCSAGSRLLIQECIYDDVIARIKVRMSHLRLGHCLDKTIDVGSVVDDSQRRSVEEMVQSARDEGAEVLTASTRTSPSAATSSLLLQMCVSFSSINYGWLCGSAVERRSLVSELSLSCTQPAADGRPCMWVNCPL